MKTLKELFLNFPATFIACALQPLWWTYLAYIGLVPEHFRSLQQRLLWERDTWIGAAIIAIFAMVALIPLGMTCDIVWRKWFGRDVTDEEFRFSDAWRKTFRRVK